MTGTNSGSARKILEESGLEIVTGTDFEDVAIKAVSSLKQWTALWNNFSLITYKIANKLTSTHGISDCFLASFIRVINSLKLLTFCLRFIYSGTCDLSKLKIFYFECNITMFRITWKSSKIFRLDHNHHRLLFWKGFKFVWIAIMYNTVREWSLTCYNLCLCAVCENISIEPFMLSSSKYSFNWEKLFWQYGGSQFQNPEVLASHKTMFSPFYIYAYDLENFFYF